MLDSILIYHFILFGVFLFAFLSEGKHMSSIERNVCVGISFIIIVIFCGTRFEVGTDYNNYISIFDFSSVDRFLVEPGYLFINELFSKYTEGYLYVFFVCTLFFYFILYYLYRKQGTLGLSLFFTFMFGIVFMANNLVRQSIGIVFFLLSIQFIVKRSFLKFIGVIAIGALFHKSILFLIPFYWINSFKLSQARLLIFLFLSIFITFTGLGKNIIYYGMSLLPKYSSYLSQAQELFEERIGFTIYLYIILYLVLYYIYIKSKDINSLEVNVLYKICFIGICISIIFLPSYLLNRISYYFIATLPLLIPLIIKEYKGSKIQLFLLLGTISLIWWIKAIYYNDHTLYPYHSFLF